MFSINNIILFLAALLGGLAVFLFKKENTKNLKLVLSFSGAYLFAITILHLMPDVYESGNKYTGLFVLLGFSFQGEFQINKPDKQTEKILYIDLMQLNL